MLEYVFSLEQEVAAVRTVVGLLRLAEVEGSWPARLKPSYHVYSDVFGEKMCEKSTDYQADLPREESMVATMAPGIAITASLI